MAKRFSIARFLKDRIQSVAAGTNVAQSNDLQNMPVLTVSRGSETIFIKIETEPYVAGNVDSIGLPQTVYTPHRLIILRDSSISDAALRELVSSEAVKSGSKVLIYEVNPLPTSFNLTGATLIATLPAHPWMLDKMSN